MRRSERTLRGALVGVVVLTVIGGLAATLVQAPTASGASSGGGFISVIPSRLVDTRAAVAQPGAAWSGRNLILTVAGRADIPFNGVAAVALHVTAAQPQQSGYLTVYADGSARPPTSNLNFTRGQTVANLVVVPVGADGKVDLYNGSLGTVQLIVDAVGWFAPGGAGPGGFSPLTPSRLVDTRTGVGKSGATWSGKTLTLPVAGHGGVPRTGVAAVAVNVTVTQPVASGYVTVYPGAPVRPGTSSLNFSRGQTVANLVVVPVGADGKINLYNGSLGTVQLIVDAVGWFAPGGAVPGGFSPLTPSRLVDTRTGVGKSGATWSGKTLTLPVAGRGGVPRTGAAAVAVNVTLTQPVASGSVTVYPDAPVRPTMSNLNFSRGQTVANLVVVPVGADGKINLYNGSAGTAQLIVDVAGWYAGPPPNGPEAPTRPPVTWCETGLPPSPFAAPAAGAVTVPKGDNSGEPFMQNWSAQPNTVYWFAPGTHILGSGPFAQINVAPGDTFVGAPGAVIDGQGLNRYAFVATNSAIPAGAIIEFLTVQNFMAANGEAVVGQGGYNGWTIQDNLIQDNPHGAGVEVGDNGSVTNNCLQFNGEYGFNGAGNNAALTNNDINNNNNAHYYDYPGSPVSCGCSGGGKFWESTNVEVTGNYVHDNQGGAGIWVDTNNAGFDISGNYISNNYHEGLEYEASYNAQITDNTLAGNGIASMEDRLASSCGACGFPEPAIYISESGNDSRVASNFNTGSFLLSGNVLTNNWGGVILWENADRYCSDGFDAPCTLVDPSVYTVSSCAANLSETSPIDYFDNCRWKTQNVEVTDNTFNVDPSAVGVGCTIANLCGFNGLFSDYGTSVYGNTRVGAVTFQQNDEFAANSYNGPWSFWAWSQSNIVNPVTWVQWTGAVTDQCGLVSEIASGFCNSGFGQDAGSSYNA